KIVQITAIRAASSEHAGTSGGVSTFVAGPEMPKNIRSTPMPAANSIAAQVKRVYLGREWSGPIFVPPPLADARVSTNTTTFVAGPEMPKNIRSTPMPAANSIAAQVKRLYLGREWSGPIFVPPTLENATISTNTTTIVAVRT